MVLLTGQDVVTCESQIFGFFAFGFRPDSKSEIATQTTAATAARQAKACAHRGIDTVAVLESVTRPRYSELRIRGGEVSLPDFNCHVTKLVETGKQC